MTDVQEITLGDIVVANPATARVLDRLGLDYCCHGDRSLAEAAIAAGLDPSEVATELSEVEVEGDSSWAELDPPALAEHIRTTHHRYLWEELPLVEALAEKVHGVHGDRHPELEDVHRLVAALRAELEPHLRKEEQVLFPAIAAAAAGARELPFGSMGSPIRTLMYEHDNAGELLAQLRVITDEYSPPADGCASYRSLYERLEALEVDTHLHVHKENHVLFPAALELVPS